MVLPKKVTIHAHNVQPNKHRTANGIETRAEGIHRNPEYITTKEFEIRGTLGE